ncbi:hypothetical protein RclHR1_33340001, partial [Rhizophagus clarus]
KRFECPKVIVWKENATQQSDLAEMPIDPKGYHYFLVVIEISRRRVDAEPIKNKFTNSVIKTFIKIYGRGHIQPSTHRLETDSDSKFTNSQIRDFFLNSIGVMMRFGEPGHHKQQSYAERAIQVIEEPLLKRMTAQELKTGETSIKWSEDFHDIVRLVDEQWQRDPPKIPEDLPKIDKNTELLLEGTQVRTKLLEPISVLEKKIHGKFRIGDIKWDPKVRIIKKLILSPEQLPTYLLDGPHGRLRVSKCAYTRKELQVIPINKKPPFDSVIRGQPERYVPEKIFKHHIRKENWLNASIKETGHTVNASIERTDIFQIHEIARNIIYHLDQLAEEDYWKAVEDYKNANYAYIKYLGTNRIITKKLYKKFLDLADKKEKAFVYQVKIEKIILQGGFVYKKEKEKKDRIINNIGMLADGLDPYEIPALIEEADTIVGWQDY